MCIKQTFNSGITVRLYHIIGFSAPPPPISISIEWAWTLGICAKKFKYIQFLHKKGSGGGLGKILKSILFRQRSCSMISNKNLLLIPATELTKLRLTCSKYFIRCADMLHKRRSEPDVSIIHTRTSNLMHFKLFL